MNRIQFLKESVVKATIVLSQRYQVGWTLSQLAKESDTNVLMAYCIVRHMMKIGYIAHLSNGKFSFRKKVNMVQLNQITKMIVASWNTCVYSTYAANRSIPRPISAFTTEELRLELAKRNNI